MAAIAPKKQMFIKLVTQVTHTLTMNDIAIEDIKQVGDWEGFIKLQTPDGDELIVEETDNLGNIQICKVIKGSPELLDILTGKAEKKKEEIPTGNPGLI